MLFNDKQLKQLYLQALEASTVKNTYHQSLFYTLGIDKDCRDHIHQLFDFNNNHIILDALYQDWQTLGSYNAIHLTCHLWNGYRDEQNYSSTTPYEFFACQYSSYFLEAIKLHYPEYQRIPHHTKERS